MTVKLPLVRFCKPVSTTSDGLIFHLQLFRPDSGVFKRVGDRLSL